MRNKKAMGWNWYLLIFGFWVALGILMFSDIIYKPGKIPKVGEYSVSITKALERHSISPTIIENILEEIKGQSVEKLNEYEAFLAQFESYCDEKYIQSLDTGSRTFPTVGYGSSYCHVNEFKLIQKFRWIFNEKYNKLQSQKFGDIDFSDARYRAYINKENDKFFSEVRTQDSFEMPINLEEKQIGQFYMKPSFKFPVDYDFGDPAKERCIFSTKCATCEDVKNRYPEKQYKIKQESCDYYNDCIEAEDAKAIDSVTGREEYYFCSGKFLCSGTCTPPDCSLDDESKTKSKSPTQCLDYSCDSYYSCFTTDCACSTGYACTGACTPYCSSDDPTKTTDEDSSTQCRSACSNYGDCSTPTSGLSCYCPASMEQCTGSCIPYCENIGAYCLDGCYNYYDCSAASCYCDTLNACAGTCSSCWCPAWNYGTECGEAECGETEVLKTRACMPASCDTERECEYKAECEPLPPTAP